MTDQEMPDVKPEWPDVHHKNMWSRCVYCGASNGQYGTVLEQHRPRCRWLGSADTFDLMHPNYNQFIEEDDKRFLPMMWSQDELTKCQLELQKLTAKQEKTNGA